MGHDFDRRIDRLGTACEKWEGMEKGYGRSDLLPMWVADMDFAVPDAVADAVVERARHPNYGYTVIDEPVYAAIEHWLATRQSWTVEREWIRLTPGTVPGLGDMVQIFTEPGDRVLIQPPVYFPFGRLIERSGRVVAPNRLVREGGRYRMDLDDLRRRAREGARVLILCSPHNPVGRVWTPEELRALERVCREEGVLVLADEVHGDLTYPGVVHRPYGSLGEAFARGSILFTAPSKTFNLAGLQTSVAIIADPELRRRYDAMADETHLGFGNTFGLTALTAAYRHGAPWLDALRQYLAGNLAFLEAFIAREVPEIEVVHPEGTYLVWLDCRKLGLSAADLAAFMREEARVALNDGYLFGEGGDGYERMNIACPRAMLKEALERIAAAVGRTRAPAGR
jgi:cysteine-S-conjugate beta-lyase